MDTLTAIEAFVRAADGGSFSVAARRIGVTASSVSRSVARLERSLGVQLFARSTRLLRLTDDGRAFHARAIRILEELREAKEAVSLSRARPSGVLRVDAPVALGRVMLAPRIPAFLAEHPDVRLELTLRDQAVDPVVEGLDVLIRIGVLGDSSLVARRFGVCRMVACASPAYLREHGTPRRLRDLSKHNCLGFLREGRPTPWRLGARGEVPITGSYYANNADVLLEAAQAGTGIVWLLDFIVAEAVAAGRLVEVLADHSIVTRPVHALYPRNRHLLPKVRAFLGFLTATFAGALQTDEPRRGRRRARAAIEP